jgi:hypothetical protein
MMGESPAFMGRRGERLWYVCPTGSKLLNPDCWVLVSFGMGSLSKRWSFPRKRESRPSTAYFRRFAE